MNRNRTLLAVCCLLLFPGTVQAALSDVRLGFHVVPRISKGECETTLPACGQFVAEGNLNTTYTVYLAAANIPAEEGLAGISCGIDYDNAPGSGVSIFGWTTCSDLEFPSSGPNGPWPAAGSANRITWVGSGNCQQAPQTAAGAFYVYAYSQDALRIITNNTVESGPELAVADCSSAETQIPLTQAGYATFSAGSTLSGCNPCLSACLPGTPCSAPQVLDLGDVIVGGTATGDYTITNLSGATYSGSVGSGCGPFTVTSGGGSFTIPPGDSRTVTVQVSSGTPGPVSCALNSGCGTIQLQANITSGCSQDQTALSFGNVPINESRLDSVVVTNTSPTPLTGFASLESPSTGFSLVQGAGSFIIPSGTSKTFTVQFGPVASIGTYTGVLTLDETCSPVTLSAQAVSASGCLVSRSDISFGTVTLGSETFQSFNITNTHATNTLSGTVTENCPEFSLFVGGGPFTLPPGGVRQVTVRFAPTTLGTKNCTISLGTECTEVHATGTGSNPPPVCSVSETSLDFGVVSLGNSEDRQFTITNSGGGSLNGFVNSPCPDFELIQGGGSYNLSSGASRQVTVRFSPSGIGSQTCGITLGQVACPDISASGAGSDGCLTSPAPLRFGYVAVGETRDLTLTLHNNTASVLSGVAASGCGPFSVVSGGTYSIPSGGTHDLVVRAAPTSVGAFSCSLDLGSECGSASLSATSQPIGQARIATHIQAHTTKLQCTPAPGGNAPAIPCSDYAVAGQTRVGYDLYLVANAPSGSGVTGAILGIDYNGAFGQGVDALGWTSCGDLDFPGNGWPQAGGGNVITWTQANCQTQTLPGFESDGVHALLGAVYVYAYSPDLLRVTERTFTELQELQVSDCALNVADLPLSAVGKVAFTGGGQQDGYNPCAPTLADCLVVPEAVLFGVVSPGNSKTLPIAIHNPTSETLVVPVSELCSSVEFSLHPSNLSIPPFETRVLEATYSPVNATTDSCVVSLGTACGEVILRGSGSSAPTCGIDPDPTVFPPTNLGQSVDRQLTLANNTGNSVSGVVSLSCSQHFSIVSGGGAYTLSPGAYKTIIVRFSPTSRGMKTCTLETGSSCSAATLEGSGISPSDLNNAKLAMHVAARQNKAELRCLPASIGGSSPEDTWCGQYQTSGQVNRPYDVYVVAAQLSPLSGVTGATFGIRHPSIVFGWTSCGELEFPGNNWPDHNGGNVITWSVQNCQTNANSGHGVHATLGSFYVYAYDPAVLEITPRTYVPNPDLQVADCAINVKDLTSWEVARVSFGGGSGYNPCTGGAAPVTLTAFTATRVPEGARIAWTVGSADDAHQGFHLFRESPAGAREQITPELLSGRTDYAVTDPEPPAAATRYWLAERSRSGDTEWHGPALLPAGTALPVKPTIRAAPNPMQNGTRFALTLPTDTALCLVIFDPRGREVARLADASFAAGDHVIPWDGRDNRGQQLRAGVYLYRVEAERFTRSGKLTVLP